MSNKKAEWAYGEAYLKCKQSIGEIQQAIRVMKNPDKVAPDYNAVVIASLKKASNLALEASNMIDPKYPNQ